MAIITIFRGTRRGGTHLAESLAEQLGYRLLSREELITSAAQEYGAPEELVESALQQRPGFLEGRGLKRLHYIHCVQAVLARVVRSDDVVYHGQAGHLLLKGIAHHLRLKVVADMEYRIREVLQGESLTREEAIYRIDEADRLRAAWMEWLHGVGTDDPVAYDLTINLERISIPHACAIVAQMVESDFRTTPTSQRVVDDLALASQIRAQIGLDPNISDEKIEVEVEDGVVTINANVRSLDDADGVKEAVRRISGVKDVRSKIATRW
jgi:cytidylate kinase